MALECDEEDIGKARDSVDASALDGGLESVGGQEDDVVGLEDRVGGLAAHDLLDVDVDDVALECRRCG